jgi:hypothetical protein
MSLANLRANPSSQQRRSQRILLSVPILVSGKLADEKEFSERTTTLVVNAHGALIKLGQPVAVGQKVLMRNIATGQEISCTVVDINPGSEGSREVGVAFPEANARFWRVSFPPPDWSPRSTEARHYNPTAAVPVASKK